MQCLRQSLDAVRIIFRVGMRIAIVIGHSTGIFAFLRPIPFALLAVVSPPPAVDPNELVAGIAQAGSHEGIAHLRKQYGVILRTKKIIRTPSHTRGGQRCVDRRLRWIRRNSIAASHDGSHLRNDEKRADGGYSALNCGPLANSIAWRIASRIHKNLPYWITTNSHGRVLSSLRQSMQKICNR